MTKNQSLICLDGIEIKIMSIRGYRVLLDTDLATIYGVTVKRLLEQVNRNTDRFPEDFMFRLSTDEIASLRSLHGIFERKHGGKRYSPVAFTEHGALMAANILRSGQAIKASIYVVRAFVKLKQLIASHKELAAKIDDLENAVATHDKAIVSLFDAIRKLMSPLSEKKKTIGFIRED